HLVGGPGVRFSNFYPGFLIKLVVGDNDEPHPPSSIGRHETAELLPGQLAIVNVDDGLVVRPAVADHASKNISTRCPVLSKLEPLDLRFPGRDLDRDVNVLSGRLLLGSDAVVEAIQDL